MGLFMLPKVIDVPIPPPPPGLLGSEVHICFLPCPECPRVHVPTSSRPPGHRQFQCFSRTPLCSHLPYVGGFLPHVLGPKPGSRLALFLRKPFNSLMSSLVFKIPSRSPAFPDPEALTPSGRSGWTPFLLGHAPSSSAGWQPLSSMLRGIRTDTQCHCLSTAA